MSPSRFSIAAKKTLLAYGKVVFARNGGNSADVHHLFLSWFMLDRAPLAPVVLGGNDAAKTAISND